PITDIALGAAVAFSGLDPDSLQGSVVLDRASMTAARIPIAQQEPTFITLVDNLVRIETFRWGAEESTLTLTGEVALGGEAPVLDLDLDGEIDARVISAFVEDVGAAGIIRTRIAATGTTEAPDIDGEIVLDALDFSVREPRLAVTDLSGTITLASDRLSGTGIEGAANGGTISIDVEASYPDMTLADAQLALTGRGIAVAVTEGPRAEIDADLAFAIKGSADPLLSGKATIVRGAYREQLSLAELALAGRTTTVETTGLNEETFVDRIGLDVAIVTDEDLLLDNNYGRAEIAASLQVVGTIGRPGITGRATMREGGQLFLGGNTYVTEQSTVDFVDPTAIEPELNFRARTQIGGHGITLGVTGPLDALENELESDTPNLTEADIISLLVTGRTL